MLRALAQRLFSLCKQPESVGSLKVLWKRLKGQASREEVAVPDVCVVVGVGGSGPSTDSEVFHWCVGEGIELITWEREGEDPLDRAQDCGRYIHRGTGIVVCDFTMYKYLFILLVTKMSEEEEASLSSIHE